MKLARPDDSERAGREPTRRSRGHAARQQNDQDGGAFHQTGVPGVEQVLTLSFPSGHTVTAFALTFFVASTVLSFKTGWWFCILAILVGFSRIYLGQHYMIDVYVGSMIGIFITSIAVSYLRVPLQDKFGNKSIINK